MHHIRSTAGVVHLYFNNTTGGSLAFLNEMIFNDIRSNVEKVVDFVNVYDLEVNFMTFLSQTYIAMTEVEFSNIKTFSYVSFGSLETLI